MKVWRLVSGILSIVFMIIVTFQSCAAGLAESLEDSGGVSGAMGVLVSILMLAGGVVSIVVSGSRSKGAGIALAVIFGLAALLGLTSSGIFGDLKIWGGWCAICAVVAIVSIFLEGGGTRGARVDRSIPSNRPSAH